MRANPRNYLQSFYCCHYPFLSPFSLSTPLSPFLATLALAPFAICPLALFALTTRRRTLSRGLPSFHFFLASSTLHFLFATCIQYAFMAFVFKFLALKVFLKLHCTTGQTHIHTETAAPICGRQCPLAHLLMTRKFPLPLGILSRLCLSARWLSHQSPPLPPCTFLFPTLSSTLSLSFFLLNHLPCCPTYSLLMTYIIHIS